MVVIGHSKGAGEGVQNAALLKLAGLNVMKPILFACPCAGYQEFTDWLEKNLPGGISFRNASKLAPALGDPVPMIPIFPYVPPYPHAMVQKFPKWFKAVFSVEWHMGDLYEAGAIAWELAQ